MTVYRYKAIPLDGAPGSPTSGELAADSPADLRASLRRIGLQVIDARPTRRNAIAPRRLGALMAPARGWLDRHLRARRVRDKSELFDSLSTMLQSGLPVVEAVSVIAGSRGRSSARTMLVELRQQLLDGAALDECMEEHRAWFDAAELAMVRAARASGELPRVLRSLAERHERAGALSAKLVAALTYPAIVFLVGLGVVVFLSTKTLPDLVTILGDSGIEPPRLTSAIIAVGTTIARFGLALLVLAAAAAVLLSALAARLRRSGWSPPLWLRRATPVPIRQTLTSRAWSNLAELVRTGVPLVEALRITAPTVGGLVGGSLTASLQDAAEQIERGSTLTDSLRDPVWFDEECRRLIAIGENAGELPDILTRLSERTHRAAARSIDRAAALLEPAVILLLAAAIGTVVMGAVLPILKLQELI